MKLGLVLGGGTAKGAFQLGILKALSRVYPPESFACLSASSIGIMNAYAFTTGQMEQAEDIWRNLPFTGLSGFARTIHKTGYFEQMFRSIEIRPSIIPDFYITYLEVASLALHYCNIGKTDPAEHVPYLKAGIAIPPFCRPVKINGVRCIDGALVDNIPVTPLLKHECDYIITSYFDKDDYMFFTPETDSRILRINLIDQGIIRETFKFEKEFISSMIRKGEEVCSQKLETWVLMIAKGEHFPVQEGEGTDKEKKKRLHFTGDMLLNRVNSAASRIAHYKNSDDEEGGPS